MFLACLNPPIRRTPPEIVGVNSQSGFPVLCTLHVFFHQLGGDTDHMLPLPVFDHVEGLQRTNDVFLGDAGHCTVEWSSIIPVLTDWIPLDTQLCLPRDISHLKGREGKWTTHNQIPEIT